MFEHTQRFFLYGALMGLLWAGLVQAGVRVEGGMTQERIAQPGAGYRGTIILRNPDSAATEVKVYQTDYSYSADGSNFYGKRGGLPRSNGRWISLSRELVTIPAKGTERIDYDVQVPGGKGVGLSGTYWSMVMVEPIAQNSRESATPLPDGTTRVTQVLRYGVQLVTHIGNTGSTSLSFTNPRLVKKAGKRVFTIDVENTGQRWLRPRLWLELFSEKGAPVGKFEGPAQRLFPGTSVRFAMDLGKTPNGKYLGMVAADGTGDNLFGANVELKIK